MIVECPDCGTTIPPEAEVCPECRTSEPDSEHSETPEIIAGIVGLIAGTLVSLLLLTLAGETAFFYAIWTLPAFLCVLSYQVTSRLRKTD